MPSPREGHIAKLIGRNKMLVHGGVDQNETSFADTYVLTGINSYIDPNHILSDDAARYYQAIGQTPQQDYAGPCLGGDAKGLRWHRCEQRG